MKRRNLMKGKPLDIETFKKGKLPFDCDGCGNCDFGRRWSEELVNKETTETKFKEGKLTKEMIKSY